MVFCVFVSVCLVSVYMWNPCPSHHEYPMLNWLSKYSLSRCPPCKLMSENIAFVPLFCHTPFTSMKSFVCRVHQPIHVMGSLTSIKEFVCRVNQPVHEWVYWVNFSLIKLWILDLHVHLQELIDRVRINSGSLCSKVIGELSTKLFLPLFI